MSMLKKFTENLELVLLVGMAAVLLFLDAIGIEVSEEMRSGIIVASLALMALHAVRNSGTQSSIREDLDSYAPTMADLDTYLQGRTPGIELVEPKTDLSIWRGFTGVYYGFNGAWRLERDTDLQRSLLDHVDRYSHPDFVKSQYLFIDPDSTMRPEVYRRRIQYFLDFYDGLVEIGGDALAAKIEMFVCGDCDPGIILFAGTKEGSDIAIMFIDRAPFVLGGMPQYAFVIKDPGLTLSLKGVFESMVAEAKRVSPAELRQIARPE